MWEVGRERSQREERDDKLIKRVREDYKELRDREMV